MVLVAVGRDAIVFMHEHSPRYTANRPRVKCACCCVEFGPIKIAMDAIVDENDPQVTALRSRLDEFYATTAVYDDFKVVNFKPEYWQAVKDRAVEAIARRGECRVLEFGAGCTGIDDFLGELRSRVRFHVQDVTPQNAEYLRAHADEVHIGDLLSLDLAGGFDVIFSTFVWEHVSHPRATLERLLGMLAPGGALIIACPRYDVPLYVPPSARHYGRGRQLAISLWLSWQRLMTMLGGRSRFYVHADPAVLNGPWYRDADAIHWPSLFDLRRAMPRGYRVRRLTMPMAGGGWKKRLWARALLLFVEINRPDDSL